MLFVACSMAVQLLQWATEAICLTVEQTPAVAMWYNS